MKFRLLIPVVIALLRFLPPVSVHAQSVALSERCASAPRASGRPSADLYCITLLSTAAAGSASGTAALVRVPSPFGVSVTPEGIHQYDVAVSVRGLPAPSSLGPYSVYVAWATTPLLRPWVRLGELRGGDLRGGEGASGRVAFNKFLVVVTAEVSADVRERGGPLVLRGMSASMRMQPHELPWLLAAAVGGAHQHPGQGQGQGQEQGQGRGQGGKAATTLLEWVVPPMHPVAAMPPGLERFRPAAAPFLPDQHAPAPLARPRTIVALADGDTLRLEAGRVRRTIAGRDVVVYGFNGQYPGPLVRVEQGATVIVDFHNRLELPSAVHWHGVRLENRFDGVPHVTQEPVEPGGRFIYRVHFRDAGIYWYHPHHREDIQQDLGLYGNLLVTSQEPGFFNPVNREEVLMLDDLLVAESGLVPYGRDSATHALMGRFGNVLLVNGEPRYTLSVRRGDVVRFHLTNASNTRVFNLSFTGAGARMKLVGSDVGKFEREEWTDNVVLGPAERYIIEARFAEPGDVALVNHVQAIDHIFGEFFSELDTLGVVRVSEEFTARDQRAAFETLREHVEVSADIDRYRTHFTRAPDHELLLTLELRDLPFPVPELIRIDSLYFNPVEWSGTMPEMNWLTTSGRVRWLLRDVRTGAQSGAIQWRFRVGDVVRLRLINNRDAAHAMQHAIHIHGQRFLVISQDGVPNRNLVWKDTILIPVGGTAELLLEVSNPGRWMLHCHVAEHLEAMMGMVFDVVP